MMIFLRLARGPTCAALAGLAIALASAGCEQQAQRQLTVLLVEYRGTEAAASAQRLAAELTKAGLPDVFIIQDPNMASLCVGRYGSWQDKDADTMLRRARQIRDAAGQYPFAGVMLVPVPEPAPLNPWPLEKANGAFTFHAASWEERGRMERAQAYAAQLRSEGYEAYVYHGPRLSMVTIGAFGPDIFDNPAAVGQPGVRPKIISPRVLDLIKKFPRMRLEGEVTPPEAHVPTQLVKIPGHEAFVSPGIPLPTVLYRVSLAIVDTRTGLAEGRRRAAGVAQSPAELTAVTALLVRQMMADLPKGAARIGLAAVIAVDEQATRDKAADVVAQAAAEALRITAADKGTVVGLDETRQILDAAGLKPETAVNDSLRLRGVQGLDFVVAGTVTAFAR